MIKKLKIFTNNNIKFIVAYIFISVAALIYLLSFRKCLIDDAYITMSYVRNITEYFTWGVFPKYITNTATSPLNVLLLSLLSFLLGSVSTSIPILLAWLCFLVLLFILPKLTNIFFENKYLGYFTFSLLLFSPLLISTMGLEGILFVTLLVCSYYNFAKKNWMGFTIALALLTLTRAEGVLFFIVGLVFIPTIRLKTSHIILFAFIILPWFIFSWIYLGSFVPDTLVIKKSQASWGVWNYSTGLFLYLEKYPLEMVYTFITLPLALLGLFKHLKSNKLTQFIFLSGLIHYLAYTLLKVPPYHWYYVPQICSLALLGTLGLHVLLKYIKHYKYLFLFVIILLPITGMLHISSKQGFMFRQMPIHTNWATSEEYKNIGYWLKNNIKHDSVILLQGEIGTIAYYCECYVLDVFTDRRQLNKYLFNQQESLSFLEKLIFNFNFMFYHDSTYFPDFYYKIINYHHGFAGENIIQQWKTSSFWVSNNNISLTYY